MFTEFLSLFISSGWVRAVLYHDLGHENKHCFLKPLVNPSQRLSEKPHQPWVAVEKQCGTVVTSSLYLYGWVCFGFCILLKDNHFMLIDWEKCAHTLAQYSFRWKPV